MLKISITIAELCKSSVVVLTTCFAVITENSFEFNLKTSAAKTETKKENDDLIKPMKDFENKES